MICLSTDTEYCTMTVIGSQLNTFVVFSIIRKDWEGDYDAIAFRLAQNVNNILKLWINLGSE